MKRLVAFATACASVATLTPVHADYVQDVRSTLERTFKDSREFANYEFYGTPVGNFGVGAMFSGDVKTGKVTKVQRAWLVAEPKTWWADSMYGRTAEEERVKAVERDKLLQDLFPLGSLGKATINENLLRSLSADVTPGLLKTVLPFSFSVSREVHVEMSDATAVNRLMNWDLFEEAMQQKKIRDTVRKRLESRKRNLVIVAGDIVLRSYNMKVTLNPQHDGELNKALLDVSVKNPAGDKTLFAVKRTGNGTFDVSADEPLVIARMLLAPPTDPERGVNPLKLASFEGWNLVHVQNDVLARLRKAYSRN